MSPGEARDHPAPRGATHGTRAATGRGGKLRVLYVSGYGRSGTTVMDIALGQHPGVVGVGELTTLTRHVWGNDEYCACGSPVRRCPFWGAVVRRWAEGDDPASLVDRYHGWQRQTENLLSPASILRAGGGGRRVLEPYARCTARLFAAVAAVAGRDVIVDSSKMPARALALASVEGIDLHVLHLVRDGRGVAWSLSKRYHRDVKAGLQREIKPKPLLRTAARWSFVNLATEAIGARLGPERFTRVRYEDFTADPAGTLSRLGERLGLDLAPIGARLARGEAVRPGHQIAGNRLRMQAALSLKRDEAWRSEMPARKQAAFNRMCGWLLRRYGYA